MLVHAFNPMAKSTQRQINSCANTSHKSIEDGDQTVNLYDNPMRIGERVTISMSLIDQESGKVATWGDGGLVIEAPSESILATSSSDMGAMNNNLSSFTGCTVLNAEQLLSQTKEGTYNEVVARCKTAAPPPKCCGFFIKVKSDGVTPIDSVIAKKMESHASAYKLPLYKIKIPGLYHDIQSGKYVDKKQLAVYHNDERYLIKYDGKLRFTVFDEARNPRDMSEHELSSISIYLDDSEKTTLLKDYQQWIREQETPKVNFFLDYGGGQCISVTKKSAANDTFISIPHTIQYSTIENITETRKKLLYSELGNSDVDRGTTFATQPRPNNETINATLISAYNSISNNEDQDKFFRWITEQQNKSEVYNLSSVLSHIEESRHLTVTEPAAAVSEPLLSPEGITLSDGHCDKQTQYGALKVDFAENVDAILSAPKDMQDAIIAHYKKERPTSSCFTLFRNEPTIDIQHIHVMIIFCALSAFFPEKRHSCVSLNVSRFPFE